MRTIIAGSREYNNFEAANSILSRCPWKVTEVVCGEARGADAMGKQWAELNKIQVVSFPADWDNNGKAAGPIRNKEMAEYSDAIVVFWDGVSKGTKNMVDLAIQYGLHLLLVRV